MFVKYSPAAVLLSICWPGSSYPVPTSMKRLLRRTEPEPKREKEKNKPRSDAVTTTRLYNYYYLKAGVTREEREVEPAMYP